ncbi:hypothetical protein [Cellulomonas fengjieae]|uniref:hypothetical protein n=1 Tax=Cellulomonas fengjieae TaxID=2819978 RepID=UPI001AAF9F26|nr:hypothetical protein [Cellulomonas fengjieae]MBO3100917.1 hypothetical protein [Cellulomonas fengjieae]
MRATSGPSRRDVQCLEALLDAHAAGPDVVDAVAVVAGTGLRGDEAQRWLLSAREGGLVFETDASLVPADEPTRRGRAIVEDVRRRRADRGYVRREAQRQLLAWSDDTGGGNVARLVDTDYAWVDGVSLTFENFAEAAEILDQERLVTAKFVRAWGAGVVRADVTIQPLGRTVRDQYNGDIAAWRAATRADLGPTVNIVHNTGAVAVGGAGSMVTASVQGFDAAAMAQLVEALLHGRAAIDLSPDDAATYDANVEELRTGDPSRIRRALQWFGGLGRDISTNALGSALGGMAMALLIGS